MKQWSLLLLLIFVPFIASAQEIRYDTIKVSPADERNIHAAPVQHEIKRDQSQAPRTRQEASSVARVSPRSFDKKKLRLGANLGLSISRNYTNLGVGPQVGYQFNDYFMAGTGVKYYYTRARTLDYEVKNNLFGINLFGYLYPVRYFALFMQPELNYTHSTFTYESGTDSFTSKGFVPSLVVGAGLRLGYTHLTLNYDLIQHSRSPHPSGFYMGISAFF